MHYKSYLLALLVLALQTPERATIEGVVTKVGTTEPVPRASIVVTMIQGQLSDVRTVVADDSGRFVVTNLAPGSHRIFAAKDGYVRTEYGQRTATRPGTVVELAGGETKRGITLSMTPTGVISGRILDPDGRPLRSAFVRVSRVAYDSGTRELRMVQRLQTNDLGEFRFFGLEPGPYYLMALPKDAPVIDGDNYLIRSTSPPDFLGGEPDVRLSAEQALAQGALSAAAFKDEVFETTYYPGTKDQAAALPIDLKPGGLFSGVELRILKSSWVHVRGRVIEGATGQPHSAVVGLALPFYGTDQRNINGRVTEGAFDLRAPAGSYMLSAQASRTAPTGPFLSAFMPLSLAIAIRQPHAYVASQLLRQRQNANRRTRSRREQSGSATGAHQPEEWRGGRCPGSSRRGWQLHNDLCFARHVPICPGAAARQLLHQVGATGISGCDRRNDHLRRATERHLRHRSQPDNGVHNCDCR